MTNRKIQCLCMPVLLLGMLLGGAESVLVGAQDVASGRAVSNDKGRAVTEKRPAEMLNLRVSVESNGSAMSRNFSSHQASVNPGERAVKR